MRLAILTGGGDVPGLNSCIKAVVMRASEIGWEVVGFRRGWGGPLHYNPDDDGPQDRWLQPLNPDIVRTIDRPAGPSCIPRAPIPARSRRMICLVFWRAPKTPYQMGNCLIARPISWPWWRPWKLMP